MQSIQSIHRDRRGRNFVGRTREIESFLENLDLSFENRKYIWNIYGQGGIGKTSLLKRLLKLSQDRGNIVASTDESHMQLLQVMGSIADQFKSQGHLLTGFAERYEKYIEIKHQLEHDPKLPEGISSIIGRAVGKASISLVRQIPGLGIALDFLGEDHLVQKAGELTSYLSRRLRNMDEVRLLLEPIELLTQLFLQDINRVATDKQAVIGFDTYEKTHTVLDGWLRCILEGDYGELHAGVILIISGRHKLCSAWADYMSIIQFIALEVLSETEARNLLNMKGVSDLKRVEIILKLSARIPLWLSSLASQVPVDGTELPDPTDQAVDRFLKWIHDKDQRRAVLLCALPERLDHDSVSVVLEDESVDSLFAWLKAQPFVQKKGHENWTYHEVVRTLMIRQLRSESRVRWDTLNEALGNHFALRRDEMALTTPDAFANDEWITLDLCSLFHKLCFQPKTAITILVKKVILALPREMQYARKLGETAEEVGSIIEDQAVKQWGVEIIGVVDSNMSPDVYHRLLDRMENTLPKDSSMSRKFSIERIRLHRINQQYEAALAVACKAISHDENDYELVLERAHIYQRLEKYHEALADYLHAACLTPNDGDPLMERAMLLEELGRYDEALSDITAAIKREPENIYYLEVRANIYEESGQTSLAVKERSHAVELQPHHNEPWVRRARMFERMKKLENALQDYTQALQSQPEHFIAGWRADLLAQMGRYDDALTGYAHAIELRDNEYANRRPNIFKIGDKVRYIGPSDYEGRRGKVLESMGRHQEALDQYSIAINTPDDHTKTVYLERRATLLDKFELFDEAMADREQAVQILNSMHESYKEEPAFFSFRGYLLEAMGKIKDALKDYTRVTEISTDRPDGWINRSNILEELGEYEDALNDFMRAYELQQEKSTVWDKHMARLLSILARYEEALTVCRRALDECPEDWELACSVAVLLKITKGYEAAKGAIVAAKEKCEIALKAEHETLAHYSLARLAASENHTKAVIVHLKAAISALPELAEKASKDAAFLDLRSEPRFLSLTTC